MKIALCISGQPRGLNIALEHIKTNLINCNNNIDVFIHCWYHPDFDNLAFDSSQPFQQDGRLGVWIPKSDQIINDALKPKKSLFEKPNPFEQYKDLSGPSTAVQTKIISQIYGIWKSNELKKQFETENNFIYDVVIRARFDLFYFENFLIKNYINESDIENNIFVSKKFQNVRANDSYLTKDNQTYSSMTDKFIFGSSKNMDKLCDIYPNVLEIYNIIFPNNYGECYLGYNVRKKHNLPIKMIDFNFDLLHRIIKP